MMLVWMKPGHSADTPIPRGANATRRPSDSPTTPYLVTLYWLELLRDQSSDRSSGHDLSTLAVLLDQRAKNLNSPGYCHQVYADGPVPSCIGPSTVNPAATYSRVIDENVDLAIASDRGLRRRS